MVKFGESVLLTENMKVTCPLAPRNKITAPTSSINWDDLSMVRLYIGAPTIRSSIPSLFTSSVHILAPKYEFQGSSLSKRKNVCTEINVLTGFNIDAAVYSSVSVISKYSIVANSSIVWRHGYLTLTHFQIIYFKIIVSISCESRRYSYTRSTYIYSLRIK